MTTMIDELFAKFEGAFAENTIRSYQHDFDQFAKWCAIDNIHPLPAPLSASPRMLMPYRKPIRPLQFVGE